LVAFALFAQMALPVVGQRVTLEDNRGGVVRFIGPTQFAAGVWVGLELDEALGKNNGTVQGSRYFVCKNQHGIFLKPSAIHVAPPSTPNPEQGGRPVGTKLSRGSAAGAGYPPVVSDRPVQNMPTPSRSKKLAKPMVGSETSSAKDLRWSVGSSDPPTDGTQWCYSHRDGNGNWFAFDDPTNRIIAAAQQRGVTAVQLPEVTSSPSGPQRFEIRFGAHAISSKRLQPPDTGIVQVNLSNDYTRVVRRSARAPAAVVPAEPASGALLEQPGVSTSASSVPTPSQTSVGQPEITKPEFPQVPATKPLEVTQAAQVLPQNRRVCRPGRGSIRGSVELAASTTENGDDDAIEIVASRAKAALALQPEPEVSGDGPLSLDARVEYSALPRGNAQDVFGLITVKAAAVPLPQDGAAEAQRQPMDVICVLDVSGSMQGDKIRQVQDAVRFIIDQASPKDRLSIVAFNSSATRSLRLRKMDSEGKNDANVATLRLQASGGTSIAAGLNQALLIAEQRRQRNTVSAILLLTDGIDGSTRSHIPSLTGRASQAGCGLYCFGFGADHDAALLSEISEQARTPFTFVEDTDSIREAFAGAIGGLSSVVAQGLELTIASRVPINAVHTPFSVLRTSDVSVTVTIPDIIAEERRDILVELAVPADASGPVQTLLLEASLRYTDVQTGNEAQTPQVVLAAERCDSDQPEGEPDEEVSIQRERIEVTQALNEAVALSDAGNFDHAQRVITSSEQRVQSKKTKNCEVMSLELQDARSRMRDRTAYDGGGKAEIKDACQMHSMQRCTNMTVSSKSSVAKKSKAAYCSSAQASMIAKSKVEG